MKKYKVRPLFIPCEQGQLFAMYYEPVLDVASHCIVHIPAFAEEMNHSRRMVALQAIIYAEKGIAVCVFDLWGTGDSQGEFGDATWAIWLKNIQTVIGWLQTQKYDLLSLWGLRSGVLLALDYLQKYDAKIESLIAWKPVLNGETFVMQFLRLRVAAAMMDKNAPQEKTTDLRKLLMSGQSIEVAGYLLNPELVNPLLQLKAATMGIDRLKNYSVVETPELITL